MLKRARSGRGEAAAATTLVALLLAACGSTALTTSVPTRAPDRHVSGRPGQVSGQAGQVSGRPGQVSGRPGQVSGRPGHVARVASKRHRRGTERGLAYSTASNDAVQAQLPPGSCHAIGSGLYERPDPRCTPGALNPAVTQATIGDTICVSGWTHTVRPGEAITEAEKRGSMAAYGLASAPLSGYEYDHFVPLELGGATNDPRNLWPEPGAAPNPKDAVEDELRRQVCDGELSLSRAQHEIVVNWVKLARSASAPAAPSWGAQCTASASYSSRYRDYDVYVHSNQPDQTVTVSDAAGRSDTWHTDSSGYADVYFKAGASAAGERVRVVVGSARCFTTL